MVVDCGGCRGIELVERGLCVLGPPCLFEWGAVHHSISAATHTNGRFGGSNVSVGQMFICVEKSEETLQKTPLGAEDSYVYTYSCYLIARQQQKKRFIIQQ